MEQAEPLTRLESHLVSMFNEARYADLSLAFTHPVYPFTMRFEVHRSIVSQSAFFKHFIQNMQIPATEDTKENSDSDNAMDHDVHGNEKQSTILTINLGTALAQRGFVLAPFQHIIRRNWQKSTTSSVTLSTTTTSKTERVVECQASSSTSTSISSCTTSTIKTLGKHILASHIRYVLRWMYASRPQQMEPLEQEDTLCVMSIAILFQLDDLVTVCVDKYVKEQLSMLTIMDDLEQIGQLPKDHNAYLQLRDAALLLLLRHGPDNPECLSDLPVDYMADILSADMLFVGCEYDRYYLIREVLTVFMRSVGKITWTHAGPVDQDNKRLSGFVRPTPVTASVVRSRKRKRIPSEELLSTNESRAKFARLSYSATVPFQTLKADASSGGVIDKATVLSHLLKTTVQYNNMTFDQLTKVRLDGIVDEEIVFRALWQRQTFEQLLLPNHRDDLDSGSDENEDNGKDDDDRQEALNDYFDVGEDSNDHRRQLLLGVPKYRFCMSVDLSTPSHENGWTCNVCSNCTTMEKETTDDLEESEENQVQQQQKDQVIHKPKQQVQNNDSELSQVMDEDDDIFNLDEIEDNDDDEFGDRKVGELAVAVSPTSPYGKIAREFSISSEFGRVSLSTRRDENTGQERHESSTQSHPESQKERQVIWRRSFYSQPEMIWGTTYRVQIEAQVIPNELLHIQDELDDDTSIHDVTQKHSLLCRFELQRGESPLQRQESDDSDILLPSYNQSKNTILSKKVAGESSASQPATLIPVAESTQPKKQAILRRRCSAPSQFSPNVPPKQPRIRYTIHCLNRREGLIENRRVDPEDRILVPVTDQTEGEDSTISGYVGQIRIDGYYPNQSITIDTVVCLEVFGFNRMAH